jgi:hypothetical protein
MHRYLSRSAIYQRNGLVVDVFWLQPRSLALYEGQMINARRTVALAERHKCRA